MMMHCLTYNILLKKKKEEVKVKKIVKEVVKEGKKVHFNL